jgi:pyruvate/2-oxoglutarate dehydrogenase complex dihydrolipoamide acyltransferase (E2) component
MIEIKLPDVAWEGSQNGVEALLDKWLVIEGVQVVKGQVLASVMLAKAAIDIEAPGNGFLQSIFVKDGDSFSPGKVLANFQKA